MQDPIKYVLWAGGVSLVITLAAALYVVLANSGSRNLALGFGALLGACVIFGVQVYFELQGSSNATDLPIEFSIDHEALALRSPKAFQPVSGVLYRNFLAENEASKIFASIKPPLASEDAPKVARDLALISFLAFLAEEQFDWQLNAIIYKTTFGTSMFWEPLSAPNERTRVSLEDLQTLLQASGNIFAGMSQLGFRNSFYLPPNSSIHVSSNSVRIHTQVCEILFSIREPFSSMHHFDPHRLAASIQARTPVVAGGPTLSDGKTPRYTNVVIGARIISTFAGMRAQAGDRTKYQAWAQRLVDGIQTRFAQ